jgi:hypothetical protein
MPDTNIPRERSLAKHSNYAGKQPIA